jgi:hypothetical protein
MLKRIALVGAIIAVACCLCAQAEGKYTNIDISAFEAAKGVDFPPDFQAKLMAELEKQIIQNKMFAKIIKPGEASSEPALKLTGVITEVEEGSRAARALVGFGAGKARMTAHVKFIDSSSGAVVFESDVKSTMSGAWSAGGGDSMKVASNLAKDIIKIAKKNLPK